MDGTKPTYTDIISADPSDLIAALTDRISGITTEVSRAAEYADLGGYDSPYPHYQDQISHLIGLLKTAHREVGAMRSHSHEWSTNDYCLICGADGRA